ncbi:helix-turn-helix domain-containing protein [Streptomyces sp. NPDC126499]|uniref:helix-turn-helix domain-containing protein n=1 Tax=Streptomyces sp. NPDC126499 TaxID=3155314 RepID=UPI0033317A46
MTDGGRPDRTVDRLVPLYRELRRRGVADFAEAAAAAGLPAEEHAALRAELTSLGLIVPAGSTHAPLGLLDGRWRPHAAPDRAKVAAVEPTMAVLRLLEGEHERLRDDLARADRAFQTLRTLADTLLRTGAPDGAEVSAEVITDYGRIQQVLEDMVDLTQKTSDAMYPDVPGRLVPERLLDRDRRRQERGVRSRAVYDRTAADRAETAELMRRRVELGVEVRVAPYVPMNLVSADDQFALVPVRPEAPEQGAILIRGQVLVRSYLTLYEYCWHMATPYGCSAAAERGGDGFSEQQRAVLRLLAAGVKDEKIARDLGVSLRTVSRVTSELMQEMGAATRFEAGVRAFRLGLLDVDPPGPGT